MKVYAVLVWMKCNVSVIRFSGYSTYIAGLVRLKIWLANIRIHIWMAKMNLSDDPAGSLRACTRKQEPDDFCPCSSQPKKLSSCDESLSSVEPAI